MCVLKAAGQPLRVLFLISILLAPAALPAQLNQQIQLPEEKSFGSKFFDQLRSIFGRFRDADLRRVFQMADPIRCAELVVNKGEWRTVAFFNEDRNLGEWCSNSLEEVKANLFVYIFKGPCRRDQGTIHVTTEFPVQSSIDAYNERKIGLDQVRVHVNAPVRTVFDPRSLVYSFELPYLFLLERRSTGNVYSLVAPHPEDSYATDVTSRWECKAVKSDDVTYRFLICRTATVTRNTALRSQKNDLTFGASAYYILSDGMEAHTTVHLMFGDKGGQIDNTQTPAPPAAEHAPQFATGAEAGMRARGWQTPDVLLKVVDVGKNEFRLRFNPLSWTGKIASPEFLSNQRMSSSLSAEMQEDVYCAWRPKAANLVGRLLANDPDEDVSFSMEVFDKSSESAASIVFDMKTHAGVPLATLQCFFPGTKPAANITFNRWVSIVGSHLTLEIRR